MTFREDAIAGQYLITPAVKSPNYDPVGHHGWSINKDGTATFFNTIQGNNIVLGPMNLGGTPYLNLIKYFSMLGETCTPKWTASNGLISTTTSYQDPFGNLALPLSAQFNGVATANITITLFGSINSGGTIPSGDFNAKAQKDGVDIPDGSGATYNPGAANVRIPVIGEWTSTVVYAAGAPQSNFNVLVKDTAGPNHYIVHSNSFVRVSVVPLLDSFLQS